MVFVSFQKGYIPVTGRYSWEAACFLSASTKQFGIGKGDWPNAKWYTSSPASFIDLTLKTYNASECVIFNGPDWSKYVVLMIFQCDKTVILSIESFG